MQGNTLVTYKILIVDDSKLARMSVAKVLQTLHPNWTRVEAANAEEALERLQQTSPDIVLLDYNMPGKDGVTLARELRDSNPRISVAVISANRQVEVVNRTEAAGATFLAKPLTEKALETFLTTVVQNRQASSK